MRQLILALVALFLFLYPFGIADKETKSVKEEETIKMEYVHYQCPCCQRPSSKMTRLPERWPGRLPRDVHPQTAREFLLCSCGLKLTWFLMKKSSEVVYGQ